jgi:hypothetical protein
VAGHDVAGSLLTAGGASVVVVGGGEGSAVPGADEVSPVLGGGPSGVEVAVPGVAGEGATNLLLALAI